MDNYQKAVLISEKNKAFFTCVSLKNSTDILEGFDYKNDTYTIEQNGDIFNTKFDFTLNENSNIESCFALFNSEWLICEKKDDCFCTILDFEKRIEKIKITFKDNIVDEYVFIIKYVEADRDLYYRMQAESQRQAYIETAQIKCATGADLVNVYFKPCCDDYVRTEIVLYRDDMLLAKFKVDDDFYFKSISGLAYGKYDFVLRQYGKDDFLIFETDHIQFQIEASVRIKGHVNTYNI